MAQLFNVGDVVRQYLDHFPLADPPRVTPRAYAPLFEYLRRLTDVAIDQTSKTAVEFDLMSKAGRGGFGPGSTPQRQLSQIRGELDAWNGRLATYQATLTTCPPDDPQCALWAVTAPVFFGYYDGAEGKTPQGKADIATIFTIANQLNELLAWESEQTGAAALWRDVMTSTADVGRAVGEAAAGTLRLLGEAAGAALKGAGEGLGLSSVLPWAAALGVGFLIWRGRKS